MMSHPLTQSSVRNRLLRLVPQAEFDGLVPYLRKVSLNRSEVLQEPGQEVQFVYFIESGVVSAIAEGREGVGAEAGQIGCEGMTGRTVVLGYGKSGVRIVTHVAGAAWRMEARHLVSMIEDSPGLRAFLLRYLHTSDVQIAHTLLASCRATVRQRIARWLLMCQDRVGGNNLPITHDILADILGARRASITVHVQGLEGVYAIRARRGNVEILDRPMLIEIANGFYGQPEEAYDRILPANLEIRAE